MESYDDTGNEKYFNMARLISDKLIWGSPQNEYWKINKLQLLRRKRPLSEEEMQELESIEKISDNRVTFLLCAATKTDDFTIATLELYFHKLQSFLILYVYIIL